MCPNKLCLNSWRKMLNAGYLLVWYCHSHIFFFVSSVFFSACVMTFVSVLTLHFGGNSNIMWRILWFFQFFFSLTSPSFGSLPSSDFCLQKFVLLCPIGVHLKIFKFEPDVSLFLNFFCILFWGGYDCDWQAIDKIWKRATIE